MKLSPLGLAILCFAEKLEEVGYLDSGRVPTAGYGHTGPEVKVGVRYSLEQCNQWLAADVSRFEAAVSDLVKVPLSQHQFDALVLFAYNVGSGAKGFSGSSLLRYLNANDSSDAATQFILWDKVRGVENTGLERRRAIEKALFTS